LGSFPYADQPHLESDVVPRALRFTQFRVDARCAPTRSEIYTGRQGHRTNAHPFGTGIGDVLGNVTTGQFPFYKGITPDQNPWPAVAAGSGHLKGMFGKHHLFNYSQAGGTLTNRLNPRAIVDELGFDESHEALLTNTSGTPGEPDYGYYSYPYVYTTRTAQSEYISGTDLPGEGTTNIFSPALMYNKITNFIKDAVDAGKPFVVDYEMNLPHGNWPYLATTHELKDPFQTRNVSMHTTYTQAELVDDPAGNNGETGDGGYAANSTIAVPVVDAGEPYGINGQVHLVFRRYIALMECVDKLTKEIEEFIETNYPDEYAKTTFMHYADNGGDTSVLTPRTTTEFAALGATYANVIPPTSDGTVSGDQYHIAEDAKGSTKDEGILSPLLVWGAAIPPALEGTDCDRYIDGCDMYPTILDLIKPEWREQHGIEQYIDGVSFADAFRTGSATGTKLFTHHVVFQTGYAHGPTTVLDNFDMSVVGTTASTDGEGYKLRRHYEESVTADNFDLYDLSADPDESNDLFALADAEGATTARGRALLELMVYHTNFFGEPYTA